MKAIIINAYGGAEVFQIEEMPKPIPSSSEILVRTICTSINPIEVVRRSGKLKLLQGLKFPKILGSDFSGVVVSKGKKVTKYEIGDLVFGMMGTLVGGAYAEYIVAKEKNVAHKPSTFTHAEAAGIPLVGLTSYQAFTKLAKMQSGQHILINGASGGVGVYAVQIARAIGAKVTAVCSYRNVDLMKDLGVDDVIDYTSINLLELKNKFDIFYDAYGNYHFNKVKHLLNPSGTYITTIPSARHFIDQAKTTFMSQKAKVVVVKPNQNDLKKLKSMCEDGSLKPIIDSTFEFHEMQKAHEKLQTKRTRGKIIIKVASDS